VVWGAVTARAGYRPGYPRPLMRVAIDVTPMRGAKTGVGLSVQGLLDALPTASPQVEVVPWELTRATVPVPPALLVRAWAHFDRPRGRRWLPPADVVHGTNYLVPPGARPATVTIHDCWGTVAAGRCPPLVTAASAAAARAVRRGAWAHVTTEGMAAQVRELYGVPEVAGAGPVPGDYVLAIGTVDHRKGFDTLVRAVAAAGLRLVLAGAEGPGTRAVDEAIAASGADVVRIVSPDDLARAALLRSARVLAYPSRYEGIGLPPLEAMSVGVPVVMTRSGAEEAAGEAARVVEVDDVDALAAALRRAHDDDSLRGTLVAAGRARAATFTWERTAEGLTALWHAAVEAG
jgi:glycosyltransferase involved in cell wall biosynthesis